VKSRAFHLALSVLLTATLLWGECLSCPRLFSTAEKPSCCKPTGCEKPEPPAPPHHDCNTHPESSLTFVKVDADWDQSSGPPSSASLPKPVQVAPALPHAPALDFFRWTDHAPPDLNRLLHVFRI
jgi:hypothetical protein